MEWTSRCLGVRGNVETGWMKWHMMSTLIYHRCGIDLQCDLKRGIYYNEHNIKNDSKQLVDSVCYKDQYDKTPLVWYTCTFVKTLLSHEDI